MIKLYSFKCDWVWEDFNTNAWKDLTAKGIVCGDSYEDAIAKIVKRLPYASNITINRLDDEDFIFLSDEHYDLVCNTEYQLGDPEEDDE